jgi:hypothetical protein
MRTLNQFIVSAVAEKVTALATATYFTQRAPRCLPSMKPL